METKIIFEEGCFDHVDAETPEELLELKAEIEKYFSTVTPEQLAADSHELTEEEAEEFGLLFKNTRQ